MQSTVVQKSPVTLKQLAQQAPVKKPKTLLQKKYEISKKQDVTDANRVFGIGARPKVIEKKPKKKAESSSGKQQTEKVEKRRSKEGGKGAVKDEESGETAASAVKEGQRKDTSGLQLEEFTKHMRRV